MAIYETIVCTNVCICAGELTYVIDEVAFLSAVVTDAFEIPILYHHAKCRERSAIPLQEYIFFHCSEKNTLDGHA